MKTIKIEVEEASLSVEAHTEVLQNLIKQKELAQKHYDIVFSKFNYGAATSVDISDALRTLAMVKRELTITTYDYQIAILQMEKAIGLFARENLPEI